MTQFASQEHVLNDDPKPFKLFEDGRYAERTAYSYAEHTDSAGIRIATRHAPRDEYNVEPGQFLDDGYGNRRRRIEANSILIELRAAIAAEGTPDWWVQRFYDALTADQQAPELIRAAIRSASIDERTHARLVLRRLI